MLFHDNSDIAIEIFRSDRKWECYNQYHFYFELVTSTAQHSVTELCL